MIGQKMALTILVLQSLSGQGSSARSTPEQKSPGAHIGAGPDQISDTLKTKHGIKDEKRYGIDAVIGIGSTGGNK